MRVPGHRLQARGAPHTGQACQAWPCDTISGVQRVDRLGVPRARGVGGFGHALCQCQWTSGHLTSGVERRRAHKAHKRSLRNAEKPGT